MRQTSLWLPSHIVDDASSSRAEVSACNQMGVSRGYREREQEYLDGVGTAFPEDWLIPEDEWKERIIERERQKKTNRQLRAGRKLTPLHQNGTNYCWGNCCTQLQHYLQLASGHKTWTPMSPASACARIKNGRNEGGWMMQWVDHVAEHGINEAEDWPVNSRDLRKYNTAENKLLAKRHMVTEWVDLAPKRRDAGRAFHELISALLLGYPVAIAWMWWRHAVLAIDAVLKKGQVGVLIDNSHGPNFGDNGLAAYFGSKAIPDEGVAVLTRYEVATRKSERLTGMTV